MADKNQKRASATEAYETGGNIAKRRAEVNAGLVTKILDSVSTDEDKIALLKEMATVSPEIQKNLREQVNATQQVAEETKAEREELKAQRDTTFWDEVKSPKGIIAGVAALGALASGQAPLAGKLAVSGLNAAANRADFENKYRQEQVSKSRDQELAARQASIQASLGEMGTISNMYVALTGQKNDVAMGVLRSINEMGTDAAQMAFTAEENALARKFGVDRDATLQGYELEKLRVSGDITEEQMALAQEYDLDKIDVNFENSMSMAEFQKAAQEELQLNDQEFQGAENAFRRAHESNLQGQRLEHDTFINALERELKRELQGNEHAQQQLLQVGEQIFQRETQARSFQNGIYMRKLDAEIEKELMRMGFDEADAQAAKSFYRQFLLSNTALAGQIFPDNPLFEQAVGVSAEKVSAAAKEYRLDTTSFELFSDMAREAFMQENAEGLKVALYSMGLADRIEPDVMAAITKNFDDRSLEKLYYNMLQDMTYESKALAGKHLGANPNDFAGAIDLLMPKYDPNQIGFKNIEKAEELYSSIIAAAGEVGTWNFETESDVKNFIEKTIGAEDMSFLVNNQKLGDIMVYLRTNDYNEMQQDIVNAHMMLKGSSDYEEAEPEERNKMAAKAAISNKTIMRQEYAAKEIGPMLDNARVWAIDTLREADARFNEEAAIQLVEYWMQALPPGTTKAEAEKFYHDQVTTLIDAYDPNDLSFFKETVNNFATLIKASLKTKFYDFDLKGSDSTFLQKSLVESAVKEIEKEKKRGRK
jgi:hypothetical protein